MRGAGIYGGRAPAGVGMSAEAFTEALNQVQAEREAEDARAYERARETPDEYEAEEAEAGDWEAGQ